MISYNDHKRMHGKSIRKRRQKHSFSVKASIVLCLLVLFFAGVNSMTVRAGSDSSTATVSVSRTKVYSPYTVKSGDTLKSIAKEYCNLDHYDSYEDYIYEICNINHISSDKIYYGCKLTIPIYR